MIVARISFGWWIIMYGFLLSMGVNASPNKTACAAAGQPRGLRNCCMKRWNRIQTQIWWKASTQGVLKCLWARRSSKITLLYLTIEICVCLQGQPLEAAASQRSTLTLGGEGGLGEIEEAQSLVEATHLLNQVRDSWNKGRRRRELINHMRSKTID